MVERWAHCWFGAGGDLRRREYTEAAKTAGDAQIARDWVMKSNAHGPGWADYRGPSGQLSRLNEQVLRHIRQAIFSRIIDPGCVWRRAGVGFVDYWAGFEGNSFVTLCQTLKSGNTRRGISRGLYSSPSSRVLRARSRIFKKSSSKAWTTRWR